MDDAIFLDPVAGEVRQVGAVCLQARRTIAKGDPRRRYRYFIFDPALPENARPHRVFSRIAQKAFDLGLRSYAMRDIDVPDDEVPDFFSDGSGHAIFIRNYSSASYGDIEWLCGMLGLDEESIRRMSRGELSKPDEAGSVASSKAKKRPEKPGDKPQRGNPHPRRKKRSRGMSDRLKGIAQEIRASAAAGADELSSRADRTRDKKEKRRVTPLLDPLPTIAERERRMAAEAELVAVKETKCASADITVGEVHAPMPTVLNYESEIYVTSAEHQAYHLNLRAYSCIADGKGDTRLSKVKSVADRKAEIACINKLLKLAGCTVRKGKDVIRCVEVEFGRGHETDGVHWLAQVIGDWSAATGMPCAFVTHFRQIGSDGKKMPPHAHLIWYMPNDGIACLREKMLERLADEKGDAR